MFPIRIACLTLLAGACAPMTQARNTLHSATASGEHTRTELQKIYAQGEQRLAPRWRGLRILNDVAVFIRQEMPKAEKGQVSVWLHRELAAPQYHEKEKAYFSIRERFVIDCNTRRLGLAEWAHYAGRFGEGQVVVRTNVEQPKLNSVLPDSLEEQVVGIACPARQHKTQPKTKKPPKPKVES